ncbi:MAG: glycosyltransferase [Candidatus Goldiibacteriota bacterium]|jgi:UDP:flavonoid glycosyltransferase YjiC (YdhE family)
MKIGLQVWGSDGDIRPMIALGAGLKTAGHQVTICIASVDNKSYAGLCARAGITMLKKPEKIEAELDGLAGKNGKIARSPAMMLNLLEKTLYPYISELYAGANYMCERSDIVVGHFSCYYLKAAALKHNKPYAAVHYWPGFIPSDVNPPVGAPNIASGVSKVLWAAFLASMDMLMKKEIGKLFIDEGLPAIEHVMTDAWMSSKLNIVACSRVFFPEPKDWTLTGRTKITGFLNVPDGAEFCEFTPELKDFLTRRGEHPVFITLGSSIQMDAERGMEMLIEAAKLYKKKVIIQTASKKYQENTFLHNIYFSARMPHKEIMPFCLAAVHHCGAGTTQTATRLGVPSVPLFFTDEQKSWADRLFKLGAAPKPLDYGKFTPQQLADNMKEAINSVKMKDKAVELSNMMKKEDGVADAVKALEEFFRVATI